MRKKLFSLLLAGIGTISMAVTGCGQSGASTAGDTQESVGSSSESEEETGTAVSQETAQSDEDAWEMVMTYLYTGSVPEDLQKVEDAVNEITIPEIQVKVTLYPINVSEVGTQYNLMISSDEKLDLIMLLGTGGPGSFVNKGQLIELDELFEKYCPDVDAAEGIAMAGGYFNGKLYAIPDEEKMGRQYGIIMRQDLLDKYGFDKYDKVSYEDLDEFFAKVKAGEGDSFYMFNSVGSGISTIGNFYLFDSLGSTTASGVLMDGGRGEMTVENLYATEEYKKHLEWMRKWYEAGYFAKDCITMTDSQVDLMRSGRYLGNLNSVEPDMEFLCTQDYGYQMKSVPITDPIAKTECYQISEWALPITCEEPEKTLEFINLMFKDVRIANLLRYGIEGLHYVKTDQEGIITYPEGVDATTSGYVNTLGLYGDKSKIYQWEPATPEIFTQMKAFNDSVVNDENRQSKALGYCFNSEPVKAEFAAVSTVINQYRAALESGSVDPDTVLPEFLEALDAAGIEDCIAENQRQLDEWVNNQ